MPFSPTKKQWDKLWRDLDLIVYGGIALTVTLVSLMVASALCTATQESGSTPPESGSSEPK